MSAPGGQSAASRMAAARLERSQIRADAARKAPSSSSAYGSFYANFPAGAPAALSQPERLSNPERSKSMDFSGAMYPDSLASAPAASRSGEASTTMMAEIGCPAVPLSSSEAFGVASKEGALHENHDRGAVAILPDKSTVLFACLDGHGAEGAAVSGYALRNLLAGAASALQSGKSASDAVHFAFARTSATMAQNVSDCRFSGSTAILTVLQNTDKGRVLTTGWVGDSRAVLARTRPPPQGRGQQAHMPMLPVPLTKDHKPTDPKERARLAEVCANLCPTAITSP